MSSLVSVKGAVEHGPLVACELNADAFRRWMKAFGGKQYAGFR